MRIIFPLTTLIPWGTVNALMVMSTNLNSNWTWSTWSQTDTARYPTKWRSKFRTQSPDLTDWKSARLPKSLVSEIVIQYFFLLVTSLFGGEGGGEFLTKNLFFFLKADTQLYWTLSHLRAKSCLGWEAFKNKFKVLVYLTFFVGT